MPQRVTQTRRGVLIGLLAAPALVRASSLDFIPTPHGLISGPIFSPRTIKLMIRARYLLRDVAFETADEDLAIYLTSEGIDPCQRA